MHGFAWQPGTPLGGFPGWRGTSGGGPPCEFTHRQMIVSVAAAPLARQALPDRGCPDELLSSEEEGAMREGGPLFFGSFFGSVARMGVALAGAWLAAASVLLLAADARAACLFPRQRVAAGV